jgi:hypothetical protein
MTWVGASTRPEDVDGDRDLDLVQRGSSQRAPFGEGNPETEFLDPHRDNGPAEEGEREVFVHRATMTGLRPGERIAYQVGQPFDVFTLVRKAYAEEVPTTPRTGQEILAGVPEAHGERC